MKTLNIVLLVCAGALGGAVVTKVWHRRPAPVVAQVEQPAAQPAPQSGAPPAVGPQDTPEAPSIPDKPSPVAPPKTEPSAPEPKKAAPELSAEPRETPKPVRFHKNPPPAHPRPLDLGQAAPPPPPQTPAVVPLQSRPAVEPLQTPASAPAPAHAAEPQFSQAPEPEAPHRVTLNAGTLIPVRLVDGLSSERNMPGDMFIATLDKELVVDGFVIAERGSRVEGKVVAVDRGTKVRGNSSLAVALTRLHTSDGQNIAIQTDTFERRSEANHGTDAVKIGGGTALGAIIGAIVGGGKGAAIGAGVGGGAGAGDVFLTRKPATLPSEIRLPFRVRTPVTLTEKRD